MTVGSIQFAKLAVLSASLLFATAFAPAQQQGIHAIVPQAPSQSVPPFPATQQSGNSVNWAGYVAKGAIYTGVSGTWVVPTVADPSVGSADATWVGIGGVASSDLIQAGTEAVPTTAGTIQYQAWYELLPGDSHAVASLAVSPGDQVSVSIAQQAPGQWLIDMRDDTTGSSFEKSVAYDSSLSSAEWIEEMPVALGGLPLGLDKFGAVDFTGATAIADGASVSIAGAGATPLTMNNSAGVATAVPSALGSDNESFSVSRTDSDSSPLAVTRFGTVRQIDAAAPSNGASYAPQPQAAYASSRHLHRGGSGAWIVIRF